MKIGIMGGTFNPIHNGHLIMAKCALEQYELDEIWFVPTGKPPHKQIYSFISNKDRSEMVSIAICNQEKFKFCDLELNDPEPSYSYKTLLRIHETNPKDELYFIMGEDSLDSFDYWVHPEIICGQANILVAVRENGCDSLEFINKLMEYSKQYNTRFEKLVMPLIPFSSTKIRERINNNKDILNMVPKQVAEYIKEHKLYQMKKEEISINKLQKAMEKELKPERYQHTIGVMYTAASLAMRYQYDMDRAMIAGVLHDCAKYISDEKKILICNKNDIYIKEIEYEQPHLLHAKVGAFLAKEKYHVLDEDIIHAILVHTTGCPEMNLLDKIIFVSDYIEPNRDKALRLREIRETAFEDINQAVYMILDDTMHYLNSNENSIDETTQLTYEYYKRSR